MRKIFLALFLVVGLTAFSQNQQDISQLRQKAVKVFIDCNAYCDLQYIKDHIKFVNYVRDAYQSEVYVLIISEKAGNNGRRYTLIFSGQGKYKGQNDTLKFFTKPDQTHDEIRSLIVKYLKIGLLPYVAKTPLIDYVNVKEALPQKATQKVVSTKWNNWIFRLSTNVNGTGESSYKHLFLRTSFDASRVTNDWIFDFNLSANNNNDVYSYNGYHYRSHTMSAYFNSLIVRSINDHWSVGAQSNLMHSTYLNINYGASFKPGIEFNLYPYSESTIHQMRILYAIGPEYYVYIDTTIFDKTRELLWRQKLSLNYEIVQKWGSISFELEGKTYLHDFTKNSLKFSTELNIRVFKGFSVFSVASVGSVHDQLYLPKAGASVEEILTRQHALATQFNYSYFVGISYTFGDIFNNVVNPRFGHGSGGGFSIMF